MQMHKTEAELARIDRQALRVKAARESITQHRKSGSVTLHARAWDLFQAEMKKLVALSREEI